MFEHPPDHLEHGIRGSVTVGDHLDQFIVGVIVVDPLLACLYGLVLIVELKLLGDLFGINSQIDEFILVLIVEVESGLVLGLEVRTLELPDLIDLDDGGHLADVGASPPALEAQLGLTGHGSLGDPEQGESIILDLLHEPVLRLSEGFDDECLGLIEDELLDIPVGEDVGDQGIHPVLDGFLDEAVLDIDVPCDEIGDDVGLGVISIDCLNCVHCVFHSFHLFSFMKRFREGVWLKAGSEDSVPLVEVLECLAGIVLEESTVDLIPLVGQEVVLVCDVVDASGAHLRAVGADVQT